MELMTYLLVFMGEQNGTKMEMSLKLYTPKSNKWPKSMK